MRSGFLALLFALTAAAAGPDPVEVLARVRDQVLARAARIPNHACIETVLRDRYTAAGGQAFHSCDALLARRRRANFPALLRLAVTDRVRFDVAFLDTREIYSWPGGGRFHEETDQLVPHGAMGTGPYASLLLSIFSNGPSHFRFEGETTQAGRSLLQYSFDIGLADSEYIFKTTTGKVRMPYSGSLLVDPQTADLVRFSVRTDQLPPETGACEVDTVMDYRPVRFGPSDFLLPASTRQRFVNRDGSEADNTYSFTSCGDLPAEPAGAPQEGSSGWPAGLEVSIDLSTPVDNGTAAAGDAIQGRLSARIHDGDRVLAQQGAIVSGRLTRVQVRHTSPAMVTIAMAWETVEIDGRAVSISLVPDRRKKSGMQFGGLAGVAAAVVNMRKPPQQYELPLPGEERSGFFNFPGTHKLLESGTRTEWLTAARP